MLAGFLEAYFPHKNLGKVTSYLEMLPSMDISSPLLGSAINTLGLAYLSSKNGDQRLVQASQAAYGHVLASLRQALGHLSKQQLFSHREIIASILLIGLYDEGTPLQTRAQHGYLTHFFGAEQYAEALGPSCLDLDHKFDFKLLQFLRMTSFYTGVATRRAVPWSRPEWRAVEKKAFEEGPKNWYPLVVPLPGLLERADAFLARPRLAVQDPESFRLLCKDFLDFERPLLRWVETHLACSPQKILLTDASAFDPEIEEHCFLTTNKTFLSFHTFSSPGQAMEITQSWMYCLIANCTLLRLLYRMPTATSKTAADVLGRSAPDLERACLGHAADLCRSVHSYSALRSLAHAHWLRVFLDTACAFFEQLGSWREAGWCRACLIATQLRVERREATERRTLCRVADVGPGFAKAVLYRVPHFSGLERAGDADGVGEDVKKEP